MRYNFSEVVFKEKCPASRGCDSFIFEPDKQEEELGFLILLVEVGGESKGATAPLWLNNLIAYRAKNSFYQKKINDTKEGIEACLKSLNQKLKGLKEDGELDWLNEFNVTLVALSPYGNIFMASAGQARSYLKRENKIQRLDLGLSDSDSDYLGFKQMGAGEIQQGSEIIILSSEFRSLKEKEGEAFKKAMKDILTLPPKTAEKGLEKRGLNCGAAVVCKALSGEKSPLFSSSFEMDLPIQEISLRAARTIRAAGSFIMKTIPEYSRKLWHGFNKGISKIGSLLSPVFAGKSKKKTSFLPRKLVSSFSFERGVGRGFLIFVLLLGLMLGVVGLVRKRKSESPSTFVPEVTSSLPKGTKLMFDLSKKSLSFKGRLIVGAESRLWVASSDRLFELNFQSNGKAFSLESDVQFTEAVYHPEQKKIFLYSPGFITTFDIESKKFENTEVQPTKNGVQVVDIDYYRDNLYLLESQPAEVAKYENMDFQSPGEWLKKKTSIDGKPLDFAIDGSIFILSKGAVVGEYRVGSKVGEIQLNSTSFSDSVQAYTNENLDLIYLYQPDSGIIRLIDKNKKVEQEQLKTVKHGIDFTIRPKKGKAYIITDKNKIYETELE